MNNHNMEQLSMPDEVEKQEQQVYGDRDLDEMGEEKQTLTKGCADNP